MPPQQTPPKNDDRPLATRMLASFRTVFDTIVGPARAFVAIRAGASTTVPLLIILALNFVAAMLIVPAVAHVASLDSHATAATLPSYDELVWRIFLDNTYLEVIWWPVMTATLILVALRRRDRDPDVQPMLLFVRIFTLCVYATIPLGLGNAVEALTVVAHPVASYHNAAQLAQAFPLTLASLVPGGNERQRAYLADVDIFLIWSALLTAYGYMALAKTRVTTALAAVFGVTAAELVLLAFAT